MLGLRSNFGLSLVLSAIAFTLASVVAAVVARTRVARGQPWLGPVARVLTSGAIAVTVLSTALPTRLGFSGDGDLVLRLGAGGLGNWRQALDDPSSLPAIQLVANVLLYIPIGLGLVVGWYQQRHFALALCLGLSASIEATQFVALERVGAVDDVVLNMSGAALGYLAGLILLRSADDDHLSKLGLR